MKCSLSSSFVDAVVGARAATSGLLNPIDATAAMALSGLSAIANLALAGHPESRRSSGALP